MRKSRKRGRIILEFECSEIIERKASKFGTGAHVILPKKYEGRNVKIIVGGEDE